VIGSILAGLVLAAAGPAAAIDVTMPGQPASGLPGGAPPPAAANAAPSPGTGAAPPALATAGGPLTSAVPATTVLRTLRLGRVGADVRALQRELLRRGQRVKVDGAFGPATRRAVLALQLRLHLRPTGVADRSLLQRLGLWSAPVPAAAAPAPATATATTTGVYLKAFPVAGPHHYTDDFGQPRAQGPHQGNDIMAAKGTPVVAVASGTIDRAVRVDEGSAGLHIYLRDAAGNVFWYLHLSAISPGINDGTRVAVGQIIGAVGNTGDARYGAAHLHFELHPSGGPAVSPYSELHTVDPSAAG
jgi:murein DD-endopeptidase MepM/ murein hydrolase activator NlpD